MSMSPLSQALQPYSLDFKQGGEETTLEAIAQPKATSAERSFGVYLGGEKILEPILEKGSDGKVPKDLRKLEEKGEAERMSTQRYQALGHSPSRYTLKTPEEKQQSVPMGEVLATAQALGSFQVFNHLEKVQPSQILKSLHLTEPTLARFTFGNKGSDGTECEIFEVVGARSPNPAGEMVPKGSKHLLESRDHKEDNFPESNQVIINKSSSALTIRQPRKEEELLGIHARVAHSHGSNTPLGCKKLFHPSQGMKQTALPLLMLRGTMQKKLRRVPGWTSMGQKEEKLGMDQLMPSPVPDAERKRVMELTPKGRHLMLHQVQLTPSEQGTNAYHIRSLGKFSLFLIDYATHVSFLCAVSLDLRSNPFEEGGDDASMARTWSMELDKELGAKAWSMEQHGTQLKEAARTKEGRSQLPRAHQAPLQGISQAIQANALGTVQDTLGLTHWTYGPTPHA